MLQELGAGADARTPIWRGAVLHVRKIALDIVLVLVEHRHRPQPLARSLGRGQQPGLQRLILGEQARGLLSQRHADRARQRRLIDDRIRVVAPGVGQGVGQDHASLRVGGDDLHRLAGHALVHIARLLGVAVDHILDHRRQAHHVQGQVQQRHSPQGRQHIGGAAHVVFHLPHTVGALQRIAARVEGDAFAHQHDGGKLVGSVLVVLQNDELGRLIAALGHGQQDVHAQFLHLAPFHDADVQARFLGHLHGASRHPARRGDVGGRGCQVAGEDSALGDDAPDLCARLQQGDVVGVELDHRQGLHPRLVTAVTALGGHLIAFQQGRLHQGLRRLDGVHTADACAVHDGGDMFRARLFGRADGFGCGDAGVLAVKRVH